MKLFHGRMKVNTCTVCEIGLFTEAAEEGEIGVLAILRMPLYRCTLPHLRVLSRLETLVGHDMFLKELIAAAFESFRYIC